MGKTAALILAAGSGTRMGASVPKQFIEIQGKPMFLYSVEKFVPMVDFVLVVTQKEWVSKVRAMLDSAGFFQVGVAEGGDTRYESSMKGLFALASSEKTLDKISASSEKVPKLSPFSDSAPEYEYVLIHDAARCLVTEKVIQNVLNDTEKYGACVAAMPSVDTIKISDENGFAKETVDRSRCFIIQTPQGFRTDWLQEGFENGIAAGEEAMKSVTDDASVIERFTDYKVYLSEGDYQNIKLTTPDDLSWVME